MPGIRGVKYHDLFWETLKPHRNQAYYPGLRKKIEEFIEKKCEDSGPVSRRDNLFGNKMGDLTGVWHFAIVRNPDIVLFYTMESGILHFAMIGDHHDYPSDGKNHTARERTGKAVWNAVAGTPVDRPENWGAPRWDDPANLIDHPDLPNLPAWALDELIAQVEVEMENGEIYRRRTGRMLPEEPEDVFFGYFETLEQVHQSLVGRRFPHKDGFKRRQEWDQALTVEEEIGFPMRRR